MEILETSHLIVCQFSIDSIYWCYAQKWGAWSQKSGTMFTKKIWSTVSRTGASWIDLSARSIGWYWLHQLSAAPFFRTSCCRLWFGPLKLMHERSAVNNVNRLHETLGRYKQWSKYDQQIEFSHKTERSNVTISDNVVQDNRIDSKHKSWKWLSYRHLSCAVRTVKLWCPAACDRFDQFKR